MCCDSQILALGLSVWKYFRGQSLKKSEKYFLSSSFCLVIRRNAIFEKSSFIKNLTEASECYCPSVANSSILKANFRNFVKIQGWKIVHLWKFDVLQVVIYYQIDFSKLWKIVIFWKLQANKVANFWKLSNFYWHFAQN